MEATEDKFLTIEEYENALSRIANPTHRVQFLLMGDAGLRVTEVCELRWSSIDVRKKVVSVDSLKKRDKSDVRKIPMSERLYLAFADMVSKKGKTTGYVFGGAEPVGRGAVNKWLKELCAKHSDLPHIHPHMLRHTFATNLRVQGAEIADIQNALGHERVDTTMIYAHADREKLRQLIEASAPKPSFWALLRLKLFPATRTINVPLAIIPDLVGRDAEARKVEQLISQGVNTLITGPIGIGKTFLMDSVTYPKKVLEIDDTKDFKKSLAHCLLHLLGSKEAVAQLAYSTDDPEQLRVKVSKESIPNLCKLLAIAADKKEYVLKIGEIDSITPSVVRALEVLKDHFIILTTGRAVKMSSSSFLWDFEKLELKPLDRPNSLRLFHRLTDDLQLKQLEWVQNKIYDTSEGNPRMITELAERIRRQPVIDAYVVDEICNSYLGRQTREIDVSPYLLLIFGGLIIFKYIGREAGEQGLTFIGSAIMVIVMFGRYFFKGAKRKNM
ncbi:tyrosine-type recombinase/integrase [Fibrella forsythiae]|uniref:Tyrosine-type recombinase/integrase n=1 Tax=Fibrella forsythiae TaxID=2817061 RepID=A0ABS3JLJ8_9BACT|nr:tyrosine-type recombinase/integrase [Fibrella forsythiae]MBO0950877.1 tyrosine-type recombinase/integrase [Fibrella forsythiae]